MSRRVLFCAAAAALMSVGSVTSARVIRVPQDRPTIQAAIDAAAAGDVVLLDDGVYTGQGNTSVRFKGKSITVRSANGTEACVIDGGGAARAFEFLGEDRFAPVVQGLTIRNGSAGNGGAISCIDGAAPVIIGCRFINNRATSLGGAIACFNGGRARIIDCHFEGNQVRGSNLALGGGVACASGSSTRIEHCTFEANDARVGGGVACDNSGATVFNCLFVANTADFGGALSCYDASPDVSVCTAAGNRANVGGGLSVDGFNGSFPVMTDSILWGNVPDQISESNGQASLSYCDVDGGWPGRGNIDENPRFVSGPQADYYLSDRKAGQPKTSRCVNAGSGPAGHVDLAARTTRTDEARDGRAVDLGFHAATYDGALHCGAIRRVAARCKPGPQGARLKANVRSDLPEGVVPTLILDGGDARYQRGNQRGKAKAVWEDLAPGDHEVAVRECAAVSVRTTCPR